MATNGNGIATRARAIDRTLADLLADISEIREQALGRVWKGNPHPDYGSALKAVELEAKLLGLLRNQTDDGSGIAEQVWPRGAGKEKRS